jgi:lysophospholipase L1-like esterase
MSPPCRRREAGGTVAFPLITASLVIATFIAGDYLLGQFQSTAQIRDHARQFREEVSFLQIPTMNLVPGLDHYYDGIVRPEGDRLMPGSEGRSLRTDDAGVIIGGDAMAGNTILFLGGSTTECNEVDEPYRFPVVVERLLKSAGAAVRVVNGGVRGHTTQDSINALLNRPGFRDADVVVLMHNINDRLRLAAGRGYQGQLGTEAPTTGKAIGGAFGGLLFSIWDWISYRSNTVFLLRTTVTRLDPFTGGGEVVVNRRSIDVKDAQIEEHVAEYVKNLRIFVSSVRILGKVPVLMTQPLGTDSSEQGRFNDAIRQLAKVEGVALIDLEQGLGPDREWAFFSDNIHMNNSGSASVGAMIATQLAPMVGSPKPVKNEFEGLAPINPADLAKRCLPPSDFTLAPGPVHLLLSRSGRYPSFTPDGRHMLFQTFVHGRERLAAYDTSTARYLDLTQGENPESERHPAFLNATADGFRVVYGSSMGQGSFETLKIRRWPQGDTEALLPGDLGGAIPAVGRDSVVFPGFMASGRDSLPNLYRLDLQTKQVSRLTTSTVEQWRPAVAPDGTVYFIAGGVGHFDIHRLRPGAEQSEQFFSSPEDEWDPAVSPDGRLVAFASKRDGNWDIYLTKSDGPSNPVKVTSWRSDEWDPSFDPSGRLLVFAASSDASPQIFGACLFGERGHGAD